MYNHESEYGEDDLFRDEPDGDILPVLVLYVRLVRDACGISPSFMTYTLPALMDLNDTVAWCDEYLAGWEVMSAHEKNPDEVYCLPGHQEDDLSFPL